MASNLLSEAVADRLVETCDSVAGRHLRSVTYFTDADYEQLFLREDLARDADLDSFTSVEWHESSIIGEAYRTSELGEHEWTMRVFENGYLLRVSDGAHGVFVTTDDLPMPIFEQLGETLADFLEELTASSEAG